MVNYPAVLRPIAATGYAGYLAHEFVPKGEPVAALKRAFDDSAESLTSLGFLPSGCIRVYWPRCDAGPARG